LNKVFILAFALLISSIPGVAFAGIFNISGNATDSFSPPPNFLPLSDTTDRLIAGVYQESTCLVVPVGGIPFDVDPNTLAVSLPALFDNEDDFNFGPGPSEGTLIDSFFVNMDTLGLGDVPTEFEIVFDKDIVGISTDPFSLTLSDPVLGNLFGGGGAGYNPDAKGNDHGLDLGLFGGPAGEDSWQLVDPRTIRVHGISGVANGQDQMRIATLAQPEGCAPPDVITPNVVGDTQAVAESKITGAGLTVGTVTKTNSNTVDPGDVISQDPAAGTPVAPSSPVDIEVSLGSVAPPPQIDMAIFADCDEEVAPGGVAGCEITHINNGLSGVDFAGMSVHVTFPNFVTGIAIPGCEGTETSNLNPDGTWDASCFGYPLEGDGGFNSETQDWEFEIDPGALSGTQFVSDFLVDSEKVEENPGDEDVQMVFDIGQNSNKKPRAKININGDNGWARAAKETKNLSVGDEVELDGSKSKDSDGDTIQSWTWTLTRNGVDIFEDLDFTAGPDKPVFTPNVPGTFVITLVVSDGSLDSRTKTRTIDAISDGRPLAIAGDDREVTLPASGPIRIILDGSDSTDPGGEIESHRWKTAN